MTALLALAALQTKGYPDYTATAPKGWKTTTVLHGGANPNRREMRFEPKSGRNPDFELVINSERSPKNWGDYTDAYLKQTREFDELNLPVRVRELTTADGRFVKVFAFPPKADGTYARAGIVALDGGYAIVQLLAVTPRARRLGIPAFESVTRSLRSRP